MCLTDTYHFVSEHRQNSVKLLQTTQQKILSDQKKIIEFILCKSIYLSKKKKKLYIIKEVRKKTKDQTSQNNRSKSKYEIFINFLHSNERQSGNYYIFDSVNNVC